MGRIKFRSYLAPSNYDQPALKFLLDEVSGTSGFPDDVGIYARHMEWQEPFILLSVIEGFDNEQSVQ